MHKNSTAIKQHFMKSQTFGRTFKKMLDLSFMVHLILQPLLQLVHPPNFVLFYACYLNIETYKGVHLLHNCPMCTCISDLLVESCHFGAYVD